MEVVDGDTAIGRFIRPAGLDFSEGDTLLTSGRRLTARDIGLAAGMNIPWLMVRRKPRIALLATGDEIVMPGDTVGANQIVRFVGRSKPLPSQAAKSATKPKSADPRARAIPGADAGT